MVRGWVWEISLAGLIWLIVLGGTHARTNEQKSPCVLQDFVPFEAAAQKGKFNNFTKKFEGKVYFAIFDSTFDHLLIEISKKGKHFRLSVFSADSKSADRIGIRVF